jgi:peptide/nickel transport system ATP-binding protein
MIAMAIACEPKLLIADEPTTALDVTIQKQILDLIAELQRKHQMSVLFITHDLAVVGEIADYVVVMRTGEIREQGPAKNVFENPRDAYTKALLQCRPRLDRRPVRLPVIEDFMDGGAHAMNLTERKRGVAASDPIILDVRNLGKNFYSRDGLSTAPEAVKGVVQAAERQDTRSGQPVGLREDDGQLTLMRPTKRRPARLFGAGHPGHRRGSHGLQAAHQIVFQNPTRLPRMLVVAHRADADSRHRCVGAGTHGTCIRVAAQGWTGRGVVLQVPARILGRSAAADRDRALPDA